jgi:hypothetical protein
MRKPKPWRRSSWQTKTMDSSDQSNGCLLWWSEPCRRSFRYGKALAGNSFEVFFFLAALASSSSESPSVESSSCSSFSTDESESLSVPVSASSLASSAGAWFYWISFSSPSSWGWWQSCLERWRTCPFAARVPFQISHVLICCGVRSTDTIRA